MNDISVIHPYSGVVMAERVLPQIALLLFCYANVLQKYQIRNSQSAIESYTIYTQQSE
jgi:hypothetical protein